MRKTWKVTWTEFYSNSNWLLIKNTEAWWRMSDRKFKFLVFCNIKSYIFIDTSKKIVTSPFEKLKLKYLIWKLWNNKRESLKRIKYLTLLQSTLWIILSLFIGLLIKIKRLIFLDHTNHSKKIWLLWKIHKGLPFPNKVQFN